MLMTCVSLALDQREVVSDRGPVRSEDVSAAVTSHRCQLHIESIPQ
jgi:hypothetical protein